MELLIFIGGVALGIIIVTLFKQKDKIYGIIEVDHNTEMCKFRITSNELSDRKNKKAMFIIEHEANISREEQGL